MFIAENGVVYQQTYGNDRRYFTANCNIDEPNEVTISKAIHIAELLNNSENELAMLMKGYASCNKCGGLSPDLQAHRC